MMQTLYFFLIYPVEKLRELSWSGVPDYMRPTVWRLLLVSSVILSRLSYSSMYFHDSYQSYFAV